MSLIYEPAGRAREYAALACNVSDRGRTCRGPCVSSPYSPDSIGSYKGLANAAAGGPTKP
jgi:hypothetical protein